MNVSYHRHLYWVAPLLMSACVLGLCWTAGAQTEGTPGAGKPPFANAIEQRDEMIRELRDIRTLMKEQNALLKQLVDHAQGTAKPKR